MTKIILCCSAGMSTSLFVTKLRKHAAEINMPIDVDAVPVGDLEKYYNDASVSIFVLAPQVKFQKSNIASRTDKPLYVIEMRDYGLMDVQKVLPLILEAAKA